MSRDLDRGAEAAPLPPDPWDPLVRISHWLIAGVVLVNGLLSKPGGNLHVWLGWVALGTLAVRLLWGFVGPSEARFSAFLPDPAGALRHLRDLLRGRPSEYPSHNPAGAIMVYALWGCLAIVVATGLVMTDMKSPVTIAEDRAAVAAGDWSVLVDDSETAESDHEGDGIAKELHELAANLMLLLAMVHVGGVVIESRALRRNLVRPMLTGRGKMK